MWVLPGGTRSCSNSFLMLNTTTSFFINGLYADIIVALTFQHHMLPDKSKCFTLESHFKCRISWGYFRCDRDLKNVESLLIQTIYMWFLNRANGVILFFSTICFISFVSSILSIIYGKFIYTQKSTYIWYVCIYYVGSMQLLKFLFI